jgi:hypothetical protein
MTAKRKTWHQIVVQDAGEFGYINSSGAFSYRSHYFDNWSDVESISQTCLPEGAKLVRILTFSSLSP